MHRRWQAKLSALTRLDGFGDARNTAYLKDAFVGYQRGRWRIRIGLQVLSWTALEAFHPDDVINSRNFDGDIENLGKIGEPMLELRYRIGAGYLAGYYMPIRIAPLLPRPSSRLNLLGIDYGDALWVGANGRASASPFDTQWAIHLAQTFHGAHIGLYALQQDDREQPTITRDLTSGALRPTYHYVTQLGLTYAQAAGPFTFKLEGAYRHFAPPDPSSPSIALPPADHAQAAAGIDLTWETGGGSSATLFAEGQAFLLANAVQRQQLSLFNPFQRDVMLGYRQDFNDRKRRRLLAFAILDVQNPPDEFLAALSYRQQLTGRWSVYASLRSRRAPAAPGFAPVAIDEAQLTLAREF